MADGTMESPDCIVIDGSAENSILGSGCPTVREAHGHGPGAVWVLCDIELACGDVLMGGVRLTPPRSGRCEIPHVRATGLLALIGGAGVDILSGTERGRRGMLAHEVLPLRIRLSAAPPIEIIGLHPESPARTLERGTWSRPLFHVDMSPDLDRLAPPGFRSVNRI